MLHFLKTADPDLIILENGLLGVDYAQIAVDVAPNGGKKMAILNVGSERNMPDTSNYPRPVIRVERNYAYEFPDPIPPLPSSYHPTLSDPVVCFTTSGTTGPSKLATHTHSSVVRMSVDLSWVWDMRPAKGTVMAGKLRYGKILEWGGRKEKMELDVGPATLANRTRDVFLATIPYCGAFGFHLVFAMLLGAGGTILMLDSYNPDVAAYYAHTFCPLPIPDPPVEIKGVTHLCMPDAVHADFLARAKLYGGVPKNPSERIPWQERAYARVRMSHCSNFANIARQVVEGSQMQRPHSMMIQG
jgi:acyl-CoA synthetase (AMP-forming)/AMP-acid ligase II